MRKLSSPSCATESRIGTVHNPALGFATVAARRLPSTEAESDVYLSNPNVKRREDLLTVIERPHPWPGAVAVACNI